MSQNKVAQAEPRQNLTGTTIHPEQRQQLMTAPASVQAADIALLLDKLGERLHVERNGVRLYEALISKRSQYASGASATQAAEAALPSLDALEKIQNDELIHFSLLKQAISELGGDPTIVTPSAALAATISEGITKVLTDPQTDLVQGLQAILAAELQDNDGWRLLIQLASISKPDLVAMMECAMLDEEDHLKQVRGWLLLLTNG